MPGNASFQFTRSGEDSRIMRTGPVESAGITTAVLGESCGGLSVMRIVA